jgi:hypothetical protein
MFYFETVHTYSFVSCFDAIRYSYPIYARSVETGGGNDLDPPLNGRARGVNLEEHPSRCELFSSLSSFHKTEGGQ